MVIEVRIAVIYCWGYWLEEVLREAIENVLNLDVGGSYTGV